MSTISSTTRNRIEAQGFLGLSDDVMSQVGPWLKLAPAICMIWTAIATYYQSVTALVVLIPLSALGAVLPFHPFDILYNHGIRHMLGTPRLPPYNPPRRFACLVGTLWLSATAWAFYSGSTMVGTVLGGLLVVATSLPTFIDFCFASYVYNMMFGKPKGAC